MEFTLLSVGVYISASRDRPKIQTVRDSHGIRLPRLHWCFEPFHNGHAAVARHALARAKKLDLFRLGSARSPLIHPWTVAERAVMIQAALDGDACTADHRARAITSTMIVIMDCRRPAGRLLCAAR